MAESSFKLCRDLFFLTWNITCDRCSFNKLFDWWRVYNLRTWVVNLSLNVNLTDFLEPRWPGFETCQMQDGEPSIRSPYHIISYQIVTIIVSILTSFWGMLLHVPWVPHHLLVQMLFKLNLHGFEKIPKAFNLNRFWWSSLWSPGWAYPRQAEARPSAQDLLRRSLQTFQGQVRWDERETKRHLSRLVGSSSSLLSMISIMSNLNTTSCQGGIDHQLWHQNTHQQNKGTSLNLPISLHL